MGSKGEGEEADAGQQGGGGEGAGQGGEHLPGQQGGEDGVEEQPDRVRGHVSAAKWTSHLHCTHLYLDIMCKMGLIKGPHIFSMYSICLRW